MHTIYILKWALLTLLPIGNGVPIPPFAPRPLCNFQLALANQACSYLPSLQAPPSPPLPFAPHNPPPPPLPIEHHEQMQSRNHKHADEQEREHEHEHESEQYQESEPEPEPVPEQEPGHEHEHEREHESARNESRGHHSNDHKNGHGHGNHHKHKMSPVEEQCCKWLAQVDDECVCELLGRLPPFLVRPIHDYTVRVAGSCNTTYSCSAQLRML